MTVALLKQPDGPFVLDEMYYGDDEAVADFVAARIHHMYGGQFGRRDPITGRLPYVGIGVVKDAALIGGCVFYNFRGKDGDVFDMEVAGAFERVDWTRRKNLRALFSYPFETCNAARLTAITPRGHKRSRKLLKGLGFRLEGVARKAIDGKRDAMIYGILKEECRWIRH